MSTRLASPVPDFMYISASAPDAPPLSDTTIGCFISLFFWMAACIIRAIWSEAPPAPAATTISTGLVGSHAMAGAHASMIASAPALFTNLFIPLLLSQPAYRHRGRPTRTVSLDGILSTFERPPQEKGAHRP